MEQNSQRGRELLAEAFTWISEGVSVVPAQPQSKVVRLSWRKFEIYPPGEKTLRAWFTSGVMNLALVMGTGGLLALDFDDLGKFQDWKQKAGDLAQTYTESTGRGVHVFFKVDNPQNRRFAECEALGLGHLCLAAPSIHPSGAIYKPLGDPCTPIFRAETSEIFSLLSEPLTQVNMGAGRKPGAPVQPGRIAKSGDVLSKIKAAFPLLSYAETLTELKPSGEAGRWFIGRCPLHDDKSPSFWLDASRQVWRCFSPSCKGSSGGDVVNLYALANNVTLSDAIRKLAREVL